MEDIQKPRFNTELGLDATEQIEAMNQIAVTVPDDSEEDLIEVKEVLMKIKIESTFEANIKVLGSFNNSALKKTLVYLLKMEVNTMMTSLVDSLLTEGLKLEILRRLLQMMPA